MSSNSSFKSMVIEVKDYSAYMDEFTEATDILVILATIKMIYTSFTCLLFCQFNNIKKITEYKKVAVPLEKFTLLGWIIWQILDAFLIFCGVYKDGNGHELKSW